MSERSFSRRLQQEGASYPKLVDTVRKELAAVYLGKRSMKLTEVAFLLGFSELSAFYRAYRRWTGMTPLQARSGPAA
jgi:AraC-like DNA-binding protein